MSYISFGANPTSTMRNAGIIKYDLSKKSFLLSKLLTSLEVKKPIIQLADMV